MEERSAKNVYGYCPRCGAAGVARERRPDGNDTCKNGHIYPSNTAVPLEKFDLPSLPGRVSDRMKVQINQDEVIWKTTVGQRMQEVELPEGAQAISADRTYRPDTGTGPAINIDIWWIVPNMGAPKRKFEVFLIMTGEVFERRNARFVGTVRHDWIVLHVFVVDTGAAL